MDVPVYPPTVATLSGWRVEDGADVEEGETVCEVEAMKTIFPVEAPATGVLRYRANLGEIVGQEECVAVIEVT